MKIFRNRTVIGVLCILLALIICFGVTPLFSRSASEKTEIVRVTKDIKEGNEITAEMVQTVEVGAYNLPQNLMTDKKEIVGKYATADLAVGDYILSNKLSAVSAAENAYLYNLDGTKQAISVTIKSFATGLSGKLESGDIHGIKGRERNRSPPLADMGTARGAGPLSRVRRGRGRGRARGRGDIPRPGVPYPPRKRDRDTRLYRRITGGKNVCSMRKSSSGPCVLSSAFS